LIGTQQVERKKCTKSGTQAWREQLGQTSSQSGQKKLELHLHFFLENLFVDDDGCTPKFSIILSSLKLETDNT
jgi:hypothetical protein